MKALKEGISLEQISADKNTNERFFSEKQKQKQNAAEKKKKDLKLRPEEYVAPHPSSHVHTQHYYTSDFENLARNFRNRVSVLQLEIAFNRCASSAVSTQ